MAAIFDFDGSGRLEIERNFLPRGAVDSQNKEKARGGGVKSLLALTPPPTPTVHPHFKSNMAGGINDRELVTLAIIRRLHCRLYSSK